jgi:hypothetical protein
MGSSKSKVKKEVGKEYYRFKRSVLHKKKHDIFESCQKIAFYASIYEYFLYNLQISDVVMKRYIMFRLLMEQLWNCYLKNEHTTVTTWKGIEELIQLACGMEGDCYDECKAGAC